LEAPVVDINNREQLAAWLRKQPREVSTMLGVRWTLRGLPMVVVYRGDLLSDLVLPIFRSVSVSWAGVRYPAHEMELEADVAHAADARAFAIAARAALVADAILASDAAVTHAVAAFAARGLAAAAADDPDARAFAAAAGARAFAAAANATAAAAFWSAISADATHCAAGVAVSVTAGTPLWPKGQPVELRTMWQELKGELHAEKQNWQVWTTWYDDRLEGRVREEEHELAYVRIDSGLWDQGPAIVNADISRLIGMRAAPSPNHPVFPETFNKVANPASATGAGAATTSTNGAGAATGGNTGSRRPVFKGFFSYSHSDAEVDPHIVEAFSSELERRVDAKLVNAKFEIWRDSEKLRAGDYWDESIETAIISVHIFVILLTPKWISSDYCRNEFEIFKKAESARNAGGYIIPIYARDIEAQAKYLDNYQKELYDRIKRIQYQQVIPRTFARLSADERIELIENAADPICRMLDRLRDKLQT
jgi:TIR domain